MIPCAYLILVSINLSAPGLSPVAKEQIFGGTHLHACEDRGHHGSDDPFVASIHASARHLRLVFATQAVLGSALWEAFEMPKYTRNTGKPWTPADVKQLEALANQNTPTRVIGLKLGRTENAVRNAASEANISLKPTNQSPYGTKKK